jgi:hypothetical protein
MRVALIGCKESQGTMAQAQGGKLVPSRLILAYFIAYFGCGALWMLWNIVPRLAQGIAALISLKWAIVFFIVYSSCMYKRAKLLTCMVIGFEFLTGFLGFFSGFKTVFYVSFIAYFAPRMALLRHRLVVPAVMGIVLVCVGILWTAIKPDYRNSLNQGTDEQVVLISVGERMESIKSLIGAMDSTKVEKAFDDLLARIGTVQIFGDTIAYVPSIVPYERGKVWAGAFGHIFKPRLFFPDKAEIQDSDETRRYTGIEVAGKDQGTSIGIGFVAESYVDFGPVFMFVPIFGVGLLFGLIYKILVINTNEKLLGFALSSCFVAYGFYTFEIANTKILGGSLTLLMVYLLFRYFFGRALMNWLTGSVIVRKDVKPPIDG